MRVRGVYTLWSSDGIESSFKLCINKHRVKKRGWGVGHWLSRNTVQLSGVSKIYVAPKTIYDYMGCVGEVAGEGRGLEYWIGEGGLK